MSTSGGAGGGDPAWTVVGTAGAPPFLNAWVNVAAGDAGAQFRKMPGGLVVMEGAVKNGSSASAVVFTLPAGYRPAGQILLAVTNYNGASFLFTPLAIAPDGSVFAPVGAATNQLHLTCCFFADD